MTAKKITFTDFFKLILVEGENPLCNTMEGAELEDFKGYVFHFIHLKILPEEPNAVLLSEATWHQYYNEALKFKKDTIKAILARK